MPDDERFGLTELADLAGVTPRTVRYYLGQGLLPAVGQSGPGAKYGPDHLARLRLIRRLQSEHLPLAEIRHRLDELDDDEIRALAGADAPAPPTDSALDYLRSLLGGSDGRWTMDPPAVGTRSLLRRISPAAGLAPNLPRAARSARMSASSGAADLLGDVSGPTLSAAPLAVPPPSIDRSQWERIVLASDVELHVRRPLTRSQNKAVDRLVAIAGELLEEDPS